VIGDCVEYGYFVFYHFNVAYVILIYCLLSFRVLYESELPSNRTGSVQEATSLINLFGWDEYFVSRQIFPGDKQTHFQR